MRKPKWKDAPHWCNWIAQDADGAWWAFECEPFIRDFMKENFWLSAPGRGRVMIQSSRPNSSWRYTLESRPQ